MNEERLPQEDLKWCPPGRRRKGRPRNSWMQEVTTGVREKGIPTWNVSTWENGEGK